MEGEKERGVAVEGENGGREGEREREIICKRGCLIMRDFGFSSDSYCPSNRYLGSTTERTARKRLRPPRHPSLQKTLAHKTQTMSATFNIA